jgi:hypothetical protein
MVEVLHLAAVLPATVGLCCAVGDRRSRARSAVPAAAMLAAMVAMAIGLTAVSPLIWAALLVALGMFEAAGLRRMADMAVHARRMRLHRALGLVLSAALLVTGGHPGVGVAVGHPSHGAGALLVVTLAGTAGYLAFTVWLVARSLRQRASIISAVESTAMGLMAALMAVAALVG